MNDDWLIALPYTKNISNDNSLELIVNYEHYDLFRIRSWLQRFVQDLIKDQVDINFITAQRDNKMQFFVEVMKGKDKYPLYLEQIQEIKSYLNSIINSERRDVLMDLSVCNLPKYWIDWMIPFVTTKIDPKLQPRAENLGISLVLPRYGYLDEFNHLYIEITNLLQSLYTEGYIVNADRIAKDWKLERVWENVFKPTWKDNRFAPVMVEFLMKLLAEDNRIYVSIKPSYVLRYLINEYIGNVIFYDFKVSFTADNIEDAMRKADTIEKLSAKSHGTIEFGEGITYNFEGNMITCLLK